MTKLWRQNDDKLQNIEKPGDRVSGTWRILLTNPGNVADSESFPRFEDKMMTSYIICWREEKTKILRGKTRHRVWYKKNFVDKFRWKCFWFWILSLLWRQSEVSCGWQRAQKASSNQRNCTKNHQKIFIFCIIFFSANLTCQSKSTKSILESKITRTRNRQKIFILYTITHFTAKYPA